MFSWNELKLTKFGGETTKCRTLNIPYLYHDSTTNSFRWLSISYEQLFSTWICEKYTGPALTKCLPGKQELYIEKMKISL
jgi:hypothetical protein